MGDEAGRDTSTGSGVQAGVPAADTGTTVTRSRLGRIIVANLQSPRVQEFVDATDPLLGIVIDKRYEICRLLGSGGMGTVYLGKHAVTGAKVAIKIVDVKKQKSLKLKDRLLREARSTMEIASNHVARAYDVGALADGRLFIVQEYLDGEDLETLLQREGPLPWKRAARIAIDICNGLASAHRLGIIHRDIKPENCVRVAMDDNPDHIKLIDFGIARDERDEAGPTQQGMLLSTPEYTAPEMVKFVTPATPRTDIYAVGITLYKLLTGTTPFRDENQYDVLKRQVQQKLSPPSREAPHLDIPFDADYIVARALEKDPTRRFSSAEEMAQAIRSAIGSGGRTTAVDIAFESPQDSPEIPAPKPAELSAPQETEGTQSAEQKPRQASEAEASPVSEIAEDVPASPVISTPSRTGVRPVDVRANLLRGVTLLLLSIFFTIGTSLVMPAVPEVEDERPRAQRARPPGRPAAADRGEEAPSRPLPGSGEKEQMSGASEPKHLPEESHQPASTPSAPDAVLQVEVAPPASTPSVPAHERVDSPAPTPPPPPTEASPQPEADFDYKSAERLIAAEHGYLRNTCMTKSGRSLSQLTMRFDIKPSGRASVKVLNSKAEVVRCVRELFHFPFEASPRGGAFVYTLRRSSASWEPVPLASGQTK